MNTMDTLSNAAFLRHLRRLAFSSGIVTSLLAAAHSNAGSVYYPKKSCQVDMNLPNQCESGNGAGCPTDPGQQFTSYYCSSYIYPGDCNTTGGGCTVYTSGSSCGTRTWCFNGLPWNGTNPPAGQCTGDPQNCKSTTNSGGGN